MVFHRVGPGFWGKIGKRSGPSLHIPPRVEMSQETVNGKNPSMIRSRSSHAPANGVDARPLPTVDPFFAPLPSMPEIAE